MERIEAIHQFWFQGVDDTTKIDNNKPPFKMWFVKDEKFDKEIKDRFEDDIIKASQGAYGDWEKISKGRLAFILLLDQFTRNIYRNTPQMFAGDALALSLSLKTIDEKKDKEFQLVERVFVYMPLQHSENKEVQQLLLQYFRSLVDECQKKNPANVHYYKYSYDYAKRHHDIIEHFGRFPHRNKILNRPSTKEEVDFLKKPGSSF
ncbi:MAG TPA: DUF924 family protein [Candidatus Omnitrophota bacterium]|nr:DUF924 family protein [Candidatus Omnitrophota bacterium]